MASSKILAEYNITLSERQSAQIKEAVLLVNGNQDGMVIGSLYQKQGLVGMTARFVPMGVAEQITKCIDDYYSNVEEDNNA